MYKHGEFHYAKTAKDTAGNTFTYTRFGFCDWRRVNGRLTMIPLEECNSYEWPAYNGHTRKDILAIDTLQELKTRVTVRRALGRKVKYRAGRVNKNMV